MAGTEDGMKQITAAEARKNMSELVNRAAYGGERFVVTRHGKELVAIVPLRDATLLDRLRGLVEARDFEAALKEIAGTDRVALSAIDNPGLEPASGASQALTVAEGTVTGRRGEPDHAGTTKLKLDALLPYGNTGGPPRVSTRSPAARNAPSRSISAGRLPRCARTCRCPASITYRFGSFNNR